MRTTTQRTSPTTIAIPRTQPRPDMALAGLLLVAALAACSGPAGAPEAHGAPVARPDATEVLDAALVPSGPATVADLLARLPQPSARETLTIPSVHGGDGAMTTLDYDGLSITTYQRAGQPPLIAALTMTSGAARGLSIGMPADAARAALDGARGLPPGGSASFSFAVEDDPASAPYQVDLKVVDGALAAVAWTAYLD